jgi:hypothetical protein
MAMVRLTVASVRVAARFPSIVMSARVLERLMLLTAMSVMELERLMGNVPNALAVVR